MLPPTGAKGLKLQSQAWFLWLSWEPGQGFKRKALLTQLSTENVLESVEPCTNAWYLHVLLFWFQLRFPLPPCMVLPSGQISLYFLLTHQADSCLRLPHCLSRSHPSVEASTKPCLPCEVAVRLDFLDLLFTFYECVLIPQESLQLIL